MRISPTLSCVVLEILVHLTAAASVVLLGRLIERVLGEAALTRAFDGMHRADDGPL